MKIKKGKSKNHLSDDQIRRGSTKGIEDRGYLMPARAVGESRTQHKSFGSSIPEISLPACGSMSVIRAPEAPTASPIVGILNAGWELYRAKAEEFYSLFAEGVSIPERLMNLNQILFKAIESSEVMRLWPKSES